MVYPLLQTNHTYTHDFYPFFEIVYTIEFCFIIVFYSISPICLYMLWNAHPFHRNLRLSLCNLVLQGLLGTTARLIFVYNQYADNGTIDNRTSLIFASILRCSMFEAYSIVLLYRASYSNVCVVLVRKGVSEDNNCFRHSRIVRIIMVLVLVFRTRFRFALTTTVGCSVGLFVVAANFRATRKLKADNEGYSVSRTFQIRENIAVIKALAKVGSRIMVLNVTVFTLTLFHLFLPVLNQRMIARALCDLLISLYPVFIITYLPLSDSIFEKSLKRLSYGSKLFRVFCILHWCRPKQKIQQVVVMNGTEQYFRMLAEQLNGPAG